MAELMIEKGATDLDWGANARSGGREYKDLVMLLIEKGTDIRKCLIWFNNVDIEYFVKKQVDVSSSEIYTKNIQQINTVIRIITLIMTNKLPNDLVRLCDGY